MPDDFRTQPPYPPYTPGQQQSPQMRQQGQMPPQSPPRPSMPSTPQAPPTTPPTIMPPQTEVPPTVSNPYYLAGFLRNFIGRFVRVEFFLGTSGSLTDRTGFLQEVGASYVVLRQFPSNDTVIGDLYSIKFVTVYDTSSTPGMGTMR